MDQSSALKNQTLLRMPFARAFSGAARADAPSRRLARVVPAEPAAYSCRNATIGAIRRARRVGSSDAQSVTSARITTTPR